VRGDDDSFFGSDVLAFAAFSVFEVEAAQAAQDNFLAAGEGGLNSLEGGFQGGACICLREARARRHFLN
jgi:hypothetical protein